MSMWIEVPKTLDELWDIFDKKSPRVIAGGTDLMVRIRAKVEKPKGLLDITRIPELHQFSHEGNRYRIGTALTHTELLEKPIPQILYDAISSIGSPQIRNMGTIGGNICNASPAGDGILPLYLLDADVVLLSKDGERKMSISEFIKGPGKTALKDGEILSAIEFTDSFKDYIHIFKKVGKRVAMTISVVSIGLIFKMSDGIINDIRIAYGAVSPTVLRMKEVENFLIGKSIDDEILNKAQKMIENLVSPISDIRATADYRKKVAGNLIFLLKDAYAKL